MLNNKFALCDGFFFVLPSDTNRFVHCKVLQEVETLREPGNRGWIFFIWIANLGKAALALEKFVCAFVFPNRGEFLPPVLVQTQKLNFDYFFLHFRMAWNVYLMYKKCNS